MRDPDEAVAIGRLKRRADFLRAAKGKRWHGKAMSLQTVARGDTEAGVRVGFTLTRKVGGAVIRNRARRRLKEALRLGAFRFEAGHDYVVIGRIEAIRQPFAALTAELARAVTGVHAGKTPRRAASPGPETAGNLETAGKAERPRKTRP